MRRSLFKQYGIYMYLTAIVVCLAIVLVLILIPQMKSIPDKYQSIKEKNGQLARLEKKRSLLESVNINTTQVLTLAESALPSDKDAPTVLSTLENLATQTQVDILSINLSPGLVSTESGTLPASTQGPRNATETRKKGILALPVKITIFADAGHLTDFIKKTLTSRRFMDIDTIDISYVPDKEGISASLMLNAYYLPAVTEIGELESEIVELTTQELALLRSLEEYTDMSRIDYEADISLPTGKQNLFSP